MSGEPIDWQAHLSEVAKILASHGYHMAARRVRDAAAENARLRIALHDAVRRPLGVTPDSAAEFYDPRMADEAEARRPRMGGGDVG